MMRQHRIHQVPGYSRGAEIPILQSKTGTQGPAGRAVIRDTSCPDAKMGYLAGRGGFTRMKATTSPIMARPKT